MSNDPVSLTYEQSVGAAPAEVYRAFTNSTALREWLCDTATASPRVNGHLFVGWNNGYYATGHFTELVESRLVAFVWQGRGEPYSTQVHVEIEPAAEGALFTLVHDGIGDGPAWGDRVREIDRAWRRSLENLTSVLTTGEDLRVTRRPMLGVLLATFTGEDVARLGLPDGQGVRLSGVVPGLGADSAGLRQDDVIVAIDGAPVADIISLRTALGQRRAGDTACVDFFRDGRRQQVEMTLAGRKVPDIPPTRAGLAERVRGRYTHDETALREFLTSITDLEASYQPGPDEWSVKQVLAHLIQGERFNHQWIGELVGGHEGAYDDYTGNQALRLAATIHAFPTVADLAAELLRLNAETLALLENLPDEFVQRKRTFWRLARTFLDESYSHIDDHLEQMRSAVDAARAA